MAPASTQCPGCNGRRLVNNGAGQTQTCPLCDGTGQAEPNYVYMPRWYLLSASALILQGAVPSNGQMTIDAIAPFQAVFMVATRQGTFQSQLTDQSGRNWQSAAVDDANMWGTAQNPFPLMAALLIPAQAILRWIFNSTSGAQTNEIQPCMIGFDLYQS